MAAYKFFPASLLRAPAFSFSDYSKTKLATALKGAYFQKALLVASAVTYSELEKVDFDWERFSPKEKNTVLKYFDRACFRPTPFGMFSNFSLVKWGQENNIKISGQRMHISKSFTEEMSIIRAFKASLNNNELTYYSNQTLYECAGGFRYLSSAVNDDNSGFEFAIKALNKMPVLKNLLWFNAQGKAYHELLSFLTAQENIGPGEAINFLNELIDVQFLVDNTVPNITGQDYLERMAEGFNSDDDLNKNTITILSIADNQLGPDDSQIIKTIVKESNQVYVNTEAIPDGALNIKHQGPILKALDCLFHLHANAPVNNNLESFVTAWQKKFEGRTLPLLHVLDPEIGIGYQNLTGNDEGKELIQDLNWPPDAQSKPAGAWSKVHALLLNKWHTTGQSAIKIEEADLISLKDKLNELVTPPSISVAFRIINDKILIESAGGVGATALIGRFTPFNQDIHELAKTVAEKESIINPDVIFAEIAHVCDFHTANINRRAVIYPYEIPVLTTSVVNSGFQIPLNDLWIAVIKGEVILYSKKLHKRVVPRLSSAFNYTRNDLAVFRFLCDLQYQGLCSNFQLDLSGYFPNLAFYPRVEYCNTVMHLATWHIPKGEFKAIGNANEDGQYELFKIIKKRLWLPEWAALTVHDNQLIFNLSNKDEVTFFLQTIKNQETIVIKEILYPSELDCPIVTNGTKPLINQFVALLYNEKQVYKAVELPVTIAPNRPRKLPPGSDWLYFKIYGHAARASEVIGDKLFPLTQKLLRQSAIEEWFFVRYADPDFHIRLRVKLKNKGDYTAMVLINSRLNKLLKEEKIAGFSIAIYGRELERYGPKTIEAMEHLFFVSSNLVAAYFNAVNRNRLQISYQHFAFCTVRNMMDCFQITRKTRIDFLGNIVAAFLSEFNGNSALKQQLDLKFRKMGKSFLQTIPEGRLKGYFDKHRVALTDFYIKNKKQPLTRLHQWLADIIHMHLNRLFSGEARKQELVLYYCLLKYEKAQYARSNKGTGPALL